MSIEVRPLGVSAISSVSTATRTPYASTSVAQRAGGGAIDAMVSLAPDVRPGFRPASVGRGVTSIGMQRLIELLTTDAQPLDKGSVRDRG
jgi:hypothetical protein